MRIVYVGNFRHSWCTEVHVARDAERIPGVEVKRVQEPSHEYTQIGSWLVELEAQASAADLLIYQRTWGLPPEATQLWRRLEARGCKTMSYHLDLYFGLERASTIVGDPFWSTGTVFTADGDPATQAVLEAMGIDHRWMPAAMVSDEIGLRPSRRSWGANVVFVGSDADAYHPEWPWRGVLLQGLRDRYGPRFLRLPVNGRRIHGQELTNLYASIPVVVGDSLALAGHENYWSDRFYETVGRGGYLVGPHVPGIEQHFTGGEHLDLYELGNLEHVFELVDQALRNREDARLIAQTGQAHVAAHHTYRHRVESILDSLGFRTAVGVPDSGSGTDAEAVIVTQRTDPGL